LADEKATPSVSVHFPESEISASANEIAHPPRSPASYKNMAMQIFKEMHIAQPYLWLMAKLQIIYKMFTQAN